MIFINQYATQLWALVLVRMNNYYDIIKYVVAQIIAFLLNKHKLYYYIYELVICRFNPLGQLMIQLLLF